MSIYYIGEPGYYPDDECKSITHAEQRAMDISFENGEKLIAIWDENDDIISVAIHGDLFDKRQD